MKIEGNIILLGDIHGSGRYINKLWKRWNKIDTFQNNTSIIQVGDFGAYSTKSEILEKTQRVCEEFDIQFYAIRGNHDNPYCWSDEGKTEIEKNYPNIHMVQDYTTGTINDKSVLFVGGAVSVDRRYNTPFVNYWEDEALIYRQVKEHYDILILHSAPSYVNYGSDGDNIKHFIDNDAALLQDLINERLLIDQIVEDVTPSLVIGGHFHIHLDIGENLPFRYICLDIDELQPLGY
jgi:predicted phosphodiesterase